VSGYLARLAARVQAAPVLGRAPVPGLQTREVTTAAAPSDAAAEAPGGLVAPATAAPEVAGTRPPLSTPQTAPLRVPMQPFAAPAAAPAPTVSARATEATVRAATSESPVPPGGAVVPGARLPAAAQPSLGPARADRPASAEAEPARPGKRPTAPQASHTEPAAPEDAAALATLRSAASPRSESQTLPQPEPRLQPAPRLQQALRSPLGPPAQAQAQAHALALAPTTATAPGPEPARRQPPSVLNVQIGRVQLTVLAPASPPTPARAQATPRAAAPSRAEAVATFSAHRHYLRVG
jgi:hypothetical protein